MQVTKSKNGRPIKMSEKEKRNAKTGIKSKQVRCKGFFSLQSSSRVTDRSENHYKNKQT